MRQRKESVHSDGGDTDSNSLNECYDNDFGSSEETSEGMISFREGTLRGKGFPIWGTTMGVAA